MINSLSKANDECGRKKKREREKEIEEKTNNGAQKLHDYISI